MDEEKKIAPILIRVKSNLGDLVNAILNSYSQIFFSTHKPFALLIFLVTFIDFFTGLYGFIAVLTSSICGILLGYDRTILKKGLLGFNSVLVGLGLGVYFTPSVFLLGIVVLASLFTFFISVSLQGVIGKYGLPFLSVPFIIALWSFMLASNSFNVLGLNDRGIYTFNELYSLGGSALVKAYEIINSVKIPEALRAYLASLSAIVFQDNLLTGIILAFGLLLFSRIAFSLSLIGFFLAYTFYAFIGAEVTHLDYLYFGFNYILTSIALGGFFLIPSRYAYFWMILLIPLVAVLTISLNSIFIIFKLSIYSLPFNLIVLLFLYTLKFREKYSYQLSEVYYQHNAPEKNLYIFLNNKERFRYKLFTPIKLPFFGKWIVSQAHNGKHTHKGLYRHAWDFVIINTEGNQFKNTGDYPEDYYCYNKPVIAPEKGIVEEVIEGIEENIIGQSNLKDNWGNSIIIKHNNNIYSKLSHLKKGTIKVKKGDEVQFGQIIANCGNSGRSPYPHLHFQVQPFPYIGSATIDYPLSNYIAYNNGKGILNTHSKPKVEETVSNIESVNLMVNAINLIPGQILQYEVILSNKQLTTEWEVMVNEYNQSYLFCKKTGAKAFFENDNNLFYFTHYEGNRTSFLFYFYLALFKTQKGYYEQLEIKDNFPIYLTYPGWILWIHDFISPFILLIKSKYRLKCLSINDPVSPSEIKLASELSNYFLKKKIGTLYFDITIGLNGVQAIIVTSKQKNIAFRQITLN
jgi:urea transporter